MNQNGTNIPRILVVEDSVESLQLVKYTLEKAGFQVSTASNGQQALENIERFGLPHLAIVDIHMPVMDGLTFCRHLHKFCDLPIIMLTAVDEESIVIEALESHADDYIVKPFHAGELISRTQRVLRRIDNFSYTASPILKIDERLQIDIPGKTAKIDDHAIKLTPTEAKILHILLRHNGRAVTIEFLFGKLWPEQVASNDRLHVHIHRLRQKIETDPSNPHYIVADRGTGYYFQGQQE